MEQDLNRIKLVRRKEEDREMVSTRTGCIRVYCVKMG